MTPSKLGRTAMFIDLEKPAPPKLFSAALLAEAEAKVKATASTPTIGVEVVEEVKENHENEEAKQEKEEDEAKSKEAEETMSALLVSPVPKREIVDAFAD